MYNANLRASKYTHQEISLKMMWMDTKWESRTNISHIILSFMLHLRWKFFHCERNIWILLIFHQKVIIRSENHWSIVNLHIASEFRIHLMEFFSEHFCFIKRTINFGSEFWRKLFPRYFIKIKLITNSMKSMSPMWYWSWLDKH